MKKSAKKLKQLVPLALVALLAACGQNPETAAEGQAPASAAANTAVGPGTFGGAVRLGIAVLAAWYGYKWLTSSKKGGRTANRRRRNAGRSLRVGARVRDRDGDTGRVTLVEDGNVLVAWDAPSGGPFLTSRRSARSLRKIVRRRGHK